jgi:hypothetical protein
LLLVWFDLFAMLVYNPSMKMRYLLIAPAAVAILLVSSQQKVTLDTQNAAQSSPVPPAPFSLGVTVVTPDPTPQVTPGLSGDSDLAPVLNTTSDPVVVTSYATSPGDNDGDVNCTLTYSDGSTSTFLWQTVNPQGVLITPATGQPYWSPVTTYNGACDDSLLGTPKAN